MKVLIISSNVIQSNSVGKITTELSNFLNDNFVDTHILYFSGECKLKNTIKVRPKLVSSFVYRITQFSEYRFVKTPYAISRIKKCINVFKPDVIHLIQPLIRFIDTKSLFKLIGESKLPCVYTMIDENAYLGNCDNAYDCEQFRISCEHCNGTNAVINKNVAKCWRWSMDGSNRVAKNKREGYEFVDNICFVAPEWVVERAKSSDLLKNRKFYVVDEYVNNIDVYYPRNLDSSEVFSKYGIDRNRILITNVAKYSNPRKGVKYFLELARLLEDDSRFTFINIGYDGPIDNLPQNYIAVGFVKNQDELAEFYSLADLSIITSLSDTMPNTSLEALSCGTPVCGFNITGIPYVADEPLGIFVEPRNIEQMADVVRNTTKKTKEMSLACREYALNRYSLEVSGHKMLNIYHDMLDKGVEE